MVLYGVAEAVLQGQHGNLAKIVFRQLHFPIEDRQQVLVGHLFRVGIGPVAFQAQFVHVRLAQEVGIVAAVRFVAGSASQVRCRLMHMLLLEIFCPLGVARQAGGHGARLHEARRLARMGIVADRAILLRSRDA